MDTGIVGVANPNYWLPNSEAGGTCKSVTIGLHMRDASTMTSSDPGSPTQGVLEDGEFELYQASPSSGGGRDFTIGRILQKLRSSAGVHVKAEVSDTFHKKPNAVYSVTAHLVTKLTSWIDRKGTASKRSGSKAVASRDTQTEHPQSPGTHFEDVPL